MVRKRVKFLYLFEGVLILMTISMILLLAGCTKEDSGMDGPTSVVKGEKIQQETVDREKATQTQETIGEENLQTAEAPKEEEAAADEKAYYGHWKIVDFLAPGITALSTEEMEGYIDVQLTYAEDSFTVDDVRLENPIYSEIAVTKEEFAEGHNDQVTFDSLHISGDFVTDVSISNSTAFGSMFYVADTDTLYVALDGAFFKAERQSE